MAIVALCHLAIIDLWAGSVEWHRTILHVGPDGGTRLTRALVDRAPITLTNRKRSTCCSQPLARQNSVALVPVSTTIACNVAARHAVNRRPNPGRR
jgi:hypothetical protein